MSNDLIDFLHHFIHLVLLTHSKCVLHIVISDLKLIFRNNLCVISNSDFKLVFRNILV